jgi:hypothetical protein
MLWLAWLSRPSHLPELHPGIVSHQLLVCCIQRVIRQSHQHYIQALLSQLLGKRLADPWSQNRMIHFESTYLGFTGLRFGDEAVVAAANRS